jgi:hypothetical protein|tara:strand:- start:27 stop:143 length:117 start_codon:yes stop_codon:yes gene_type:complete
MLHTLEVVVVLKEVLMVDLVVLEEQVVVDLEQGNLPKV